MTTMTSTLRAPKKNVAPAHNHDRIWWLICFDNFVIYLYIYMIWYFWDIWYVYTIYIGISRCPALLGTATMTSFEIASRGGWMDCARTNLLWLEYRPSMGDKLEWLLVLNRRDLGGNDEWTTIFQICLIISAWSIWSFPFKMKGALVRKKFQPGIQHLSESHLESPVFCRSRRYNVGREKWWIPCAIALEPGRHTADSYSVFLMIW